MLLFLFAYFLIHLEVISWDKTGSHLTYMQLGVKEHQRLPDLCCQFLERPTFLLDVLSGLFYVSTQAH